MEHLPLNFEVLWSISQSGSVRSFPIHWMVRRSRTCSVIIRPSLRPSTLLCQCITSIAFKASSISSCGQNLVFHTCFFFQVATPITAPYCTIGSCSPHMSQPFQLWPPKQFDYAFSIKFLSSVFFHIFIL